MPCHRQRQGPSSTAAPAAEAGMKRAETFIHSCSRLSLLLLRRRGRLSAEDELQLSHSTTALAFVPNAFACVHVCTCPSLLEHTVNGDQLMAAAGVCLTERTFDFDVRLTTATPRQASRSADADASTISVSLLSCFRSRILSPLLFHQVPCTKTAAPASLRMQGALA